MIHRFDQITVDLPAPNGPDANAAAAVQELLGGKFGEMSTLMNYTFQSFNFRGKKNFRPFYDLISNIAAEEYSHIEAVTATINLLLTGTTPRARTATRARRPTARSPNPAAKHKDAKKEPRPAQGSRQFQRNTSHFLNSGQQALPMDSMGRFWTGENVFLQRQPQARPAAQFLPGMRRARREKSRAYESNRRPLRPRDDRLPAGARRHAHRRVCEGVGGPHRRERFRGLLPIPDISNRKFPEARKLEEEQGLHLIQYHQSKDYTQIAKIWNGPHPEDGKPLVVVDEMPKGYPWPDLDDRTATRLAERHRPGHDQILRGQAGLTLGRGKHAGAGSGSIGEGARARRRGGHSA